MDISLVRASIYDLPSRQRLDALVYDGSSDMQLWPGRGADFDLDERFGGRLQEALDAEIRQLPDRTLPLFEVVRVVRGRLHCDFLAWVATRPPQTGVRPEPAPDAAGIAKAVKASLQFASSRHVKRIGFSAMGAGPGELPAADRLIAVIRAAHEYEEECAAAGLATGVDEVLVCETLGSVYQKVANAVRDLAKIDNLVAQQASVRAATIKRDTSRSSSAGRKATTRKGQKLAAPEVDAHRHNATPYSPRVRFTAGDWITHSRFGIGRVEEVTPGDSTEQARVLFEDGVERRLVHARGE
jgi:O-acetyl-ADP-ribose deacetylase (regulator of RNase III)